jgi:hypothetical protein
VPRAAVEVPARRRHIMARLAGTVRTSDALSRFRFSFAVTPRFSHVFSHFAVVGVRF